jgi:hypothetical protein
MSHKELGLLAFESQNGETLGALLLTGVRVPGAWRQLAGSHQDLQVPWGANPSREAPHAADLDWSRLPS